MMRPFQGLLVQCEHKLHVPEVTLGGEQGTLSFGCCFISEELKEQMPPEVSPPSKALVWPRCGFSAKDRS